MTEPRDGLQWLRDANTGWREFGDAQRDRANSAERWAYDEQRKRLEAQRSAATWRAQAIIAYGWLCALIANVRWHWPTWIGVPLIAVATLVDVALRHRRKTRAHRKAENDG